MTSGSPPDDAAAPEYASGGLILGPGGSDSVPVFIDTRCERIFTAEEVRRFTAAKPGSREALQGDSDASPA